MSMFSGLTNQISGMVAQKLGKGGAEGEGAEGDPNAAAAAPAVAGGEENGEQGELGEEGAAGAGGVSGLAQGLMAKAMSAKDGIKEKAAGFNTDQVKGMGMGLMANVTNLIPGRRVHICMRIS